MNTKEGLELYLNTIEFKLSNFDKTSEKYNNYKKDKFNDIKKYWDMCSVDYFDLYEDFAQSSNYYLDLLNEVQRNMTKRNIRFIKTQVNYKMTEGIKNWIDNNFDLNANELKSFTIKFYLSSYKDINETMKEILKDLILIK